MSKLEEQKIITRDKLQNELIEYKDAHYKRQLEFVEYFEDVLEKDDIILDIGCRDGTILEILKNKGYDDSYGIECTEEAVELCQNKKLEVNYSDAHKIFYNNNIFDVIILSHVMEHFYDLDKVITECKRICVDNHKLLVEIPLEKNAHKESGHYTSFSSIEEVDNFMLKHGYKASEKYFFKLGKNKSIYRVKFHKEK